MLSQVSSKAGRAFASGRRGAPREFQEVEAELSGLAKVLKHLVETLFADADNTIFARANHLTQHGFAALLESCQRTLRDLDSLVDQYQVVKEDYQSSGVIVDRVWSEVVLSSYKSIMWTSEGGSIQDLRNMLAVHKSAIVFVLQALQKYYMGWTTTLV